MLHKSTVPTLIRIGFIRIGIENLILLSSKNSNVEHFCYNTIVKDNLGLNYSKILQQKCLITIAVEVRVVLKSS